MPVLPPDYLNELKSIPLQGRLATGENVVINISDPPTDYRKQQLVRCLKSDKATRWEYSEIGTKTYIAISHTWGSQLETQTIAGKEVQVSPWKAQHFEDWVEETIPNEWFWMDIFCIPQVEESVAACIQSIPYIYSHAECVYVLLEDQMPLSLPSFHEFAQTYFEQPLNAGRSLPILELVTAELQRRSIAYPNPDWIYRLWTRQEAQYAKAISFHGVAESRQAESNTRSQRAAYGLGRLCQLASSMGTNWEQTSELLLEMIAARGRRMIDLPGLGLQQIRGLHSALSELRVARRRTSKPRDYVLALFPTFPWYQVPEDARQQELESLLNDALKQFENTRHCTILPITRSWRIPYVAPRLTQENVRLAPDHTFDIFSRFATIEHCRRSSQSNPRSWLNEEARVSIIDWNLGVWLDVLSSVCIGHTLQYNSLERYAALEALLEENQGNISLEQQDALREFVLCRNPIPLSLVEEREDVIKWISCIHLLITSRELRHALGSGAYLALVKADDTRLYPALLYGRTSNIYIYTLPSADTPDAGIVWLSERTGNHECRLVGVAGGYLARPTALRSEPDWNTIHISSSSDHYIQTYTAVDTDKQGTTTVSRVVQAVPIITYRI